MNSNISVVEPQVSLAVVLVAIDLSLNNLMSMLINKSEIKDTCENVHAVNTSL